MFEVENMFMIFNPKSNQGKKKLNIIKPTFRKESQFYLEKIRW